MKTHFLFPNKYKLIGWILFVPSLIIQIITIVFKIDLDDYLNVNVLALYQETLGEKSGFFRIIENSICDELLTVFLIIGGVLICFSKLKTKTNTFPKYAMKAWFGQLI